MITDAYPAIASHVIRQTVCLSLLSLCDNVGHVKATQTVRVNKLPLTPAASPYAYLPGAVSASLSPRGPVEDRRKRGRRQPLVSKDVWEGKETVPDDKCMGSCVIG